jgi:endonuclease I
MIEKILKRFGYTKALKDKDIYTMFAEEIGDIRQYEINSKFEKVLFEQFATLDGATDYLKATIAADMQRYFSAPDERSRDIIRGGIARTSYFLSLCKQKRGETKLENLRYGK